MFPRRIVRSTRTRSDSTTVVGTGSGGSAQRRTSCLKRRSKRTARWQSWHSARWASSSSQVVGGASWSRYSQTNPRTSLQSRQSAAAAYFGRTHSCPSSSSPRSAANSHSRRCSWRRPRCSLDITVPIEVPMMSAISL